MFFYPFTFAEPDTVLEGQTAEEYSTTGIATVDGVVGDEFDAVVENDGPSYLYHRSTEGSVYVRELYEEDGVVYVRIETNTPDSYFVDRELRRFGGQVVTQSEEEDRYVTILIADDPDQPVEESIKIMEDVFLRSLGQIAYEVEPASDVNSTLVPRDGWYDHEDVRWDYRITDASGEIHVDPESDTVLHADVQFHRTNAGSYLGYFRNSDDGVSIDIKYDVEIGPTTVDTPEWVDEIRSSEESD